MWHMFRRHASRGAQVSMMLAALFMAVQSVVVLRTADLSTECLCCQTQVAAFDNDTTDATSVTCCVAERAPGLASESAGSEVPAERGACQCDQPCCAALTGLPLAMLPSALDLRIGLPVCDDVMAGNLHLPAWACPVPHGPPRS